MERLTKRCQMSFEVQVPASSANLGPGFDSLAVALSLYLRVVVDVEGEPAMLARSAGSAGRGRPHCSPGWRRLPNICGSSLPEVSLLYDSQIPVARGLGSSAAALVAGLQIGALLASGIELEATDLIDSAGRSKGTPTTFRRLCLGA